MSVLKIALLGFFFGFVAPAYAAQGDAYEFSDWQNASNPFARSESVNGIAIAGAVPLDHPAGAQVNATWSCVKDGTELAIGITGGTLDYSPKTDRLPVKIKIDNGAITTASVTPESARRFIIGRNLDPRMLFANDVLNISKASALYVGFPANGEDIALRISLHNGAVSRFLGSCLVALQNNNPAAKKVADAEIKPAAVAKPAAPVSAPAKPIAVETAPPPAPTSVSAPVAASTPDIKTVQTDVAPDAQPAPPVLAGNSPAPDLALLPPSDKSINAARRKEFGRFNLRGGEEIILRKEYAPGALIRLGNMYNDMPISDADKIQKKTGDVNISGDATLSIIDVHRDRDGLDDWYYVQITCTACSAANPAEPGANEGWVAASDVIAWRDDPLCVKGRRGCE